MKKIKTLNEESNILNTKNEEEDDEKDDKENNKEDNKEEEEMSEDDEDEEDIISQNSMILNFGEILKKIHEIMKIRFYSIYLKHIDINIFDLYIIIFF